MKPLASVFTEAQFDGDVSGLTWVTGTAGDRDINMNNEKVQGTGILIVDGDLTINQTTAEVNSCGFKGIIYVRGNVDIRGNLQLCGAIVVEGSILSSDGLTVTGVDDDDSDFGGTAARCRTTRKPSSTLSRRLVPTPSRAFQRDGGSGEDPGFHPRGSADRDRHHRCADGSGHAHLPRVAGRQ
ncbi:hypothetical protein ACFSC4_30760 [Deinococcus malanensis]|uniref:hypothetical protein n=1 Tax=Deinococcus malanensis TaxID=1706855 RepID=UPI003631D36E